MIETEKEYLNKIIEYLTENYKEVLAENAIPYYSALVALNRTIEKFDRRKGVNL